MDAVLKVCTGNSGGPEEGEWLGLFRVVCGGGRADRGF